MKNDYQIGKMRISIPPTLLFSVAAKVADVRNAVTMDFKGAGHFIYILGKTYRDFGATEYALMKNISETTVPTVRRPSISAKLYTLLHKAISSRLILAAHDLSDGGLGVALTEMCFAGDLGAEADLKLVPASGCTTEAEVLFSESPGRILIEVSQENAPNIETLFAYMPFACIGITSRGDSISLKGFGGETVLAVSRVDAKNAWKSTLDF